MLQVYPLLNGSNKGLHVSKQSNALHELNSWDFNNISNKCDNQILKIISRIIS